MPGPFDHAVPLTVSSTDPFYALLQSAPTPAPGHAPTGFGGFGGPSVRSDLRSDQLLSDIWPQPYRGPLDLDNFGRETPEMRRAFRELYAKEPAVRASIDGRAASVAALDVSVLADDADSDEDKRAAEFVDWCVERTPRGWDGLVTDAFKPALIDGFAVLEVTLEEVRSRKWGQKWGLKHVRSVDTAHVKLQLDQYRNVVSVVNTVRGLEYHGPRKEIIFTHGELFHNPFGMAVLRPAYRNAYLINVAYEIWATAIKVFGAPVVTGRYKTAETRGILEKALQALRAGGYMAVPDGAEVDVLNFASATGFDAFESHVAKCREEIYLAVRGAYLPFTQGSGGADQRGDTATHKVASDALEYLDAKAVARCLTRQLVPHLVRPNFGDEVGLPKIVFGGTNWGETKQQLDVASQLQQMKLPLSKKQLYEIGQFSPPADDDDTLAPPDAGPGGPPGPQPPGAGPGGGLFAEEERQRADERFAAVMSAVRSEHARLAPKPVGADAGGTGGREPGRAADTGTGPAAESEPAPAAGGVAKSSPASPAQPAKPAKPPAAAGAAVGQVGGSERAQVDGRPRQPRPPEPGFTGVDANGHRWENGHQVRREAGEFRERFDDALTGDERDILTELAGTGNEELVPLTLAEWHDTDHPRGQPDNAGQFAPGDGGGSKPDKKETRDAKKAEKPKATRGEMTGARREGRGNGARIVLADGSPAPDHIKPSMIPPAWSDVRVSLDPHADLQVTGRDAKGRPKSVYRDEFSMRTAAVKFARVQEGLAKADEMARQNQANRADPALQEHADCVWLMMEQATRPGSDKDTGAKTKAYGATTLEGRHVVSTPEGVRLQFIGKEGVYHDHLIRDPELGKMLLARSKAAGPNGKLFGTNYLQVAKYTKTKLDGGKFTPKDFRTMHATRLAIDAVNAEDPPKTEKDYKAAVKRVAEKVSGVLGNRPKQALESYIAPEVFSGWRAGLGQSGIHRRQGGPDAASSPASTAAPQPIPAAVTATADQWLAGADHLPAELRTAYHGHLTHALTGMPESARKRAVDAVNRGRQQFHPDVASVTKAAAAITKKREKGVHGFVHDLAGGAVEIHLDSGTETDPKAEYGARGTYIHELWHAVDADHYYTDRPKWQAAYIKDVLKGRHLLSRYAMESPSEGFAELGRVLQEKGAAHVKERWPKCYKFLETEKLL